MGNCFWWSASISAVIWSGRAFGFSTDVMCLTVETQDISA